MLSTGDQRGFLAYIVRDDKTRFVEHQVKQDEGTAETSPNTSCFLESEEGSTFIICLDMNQASIFRPDDELTITIYVDGRRIAYLSPSRRSARYDIQRVSTMLSEDQGRMMEGKLVFTDLKTTDDEDEVTLDANTLRAIGRIQVDLHRGKRHGLEEEYCKAVKSDMGIASELGKKLGGVVGSIGQKAYIPSEAVDWELYDKDKPFYQFIFNYRTRPVLELMNVIDTTHRQFPEEERDRPRKRKSDEVADDEHEVDNEVDDEDIVNVKPGQDELLTARLHDLQRQVKEVEERLKRSKGKRPIPPFPCWSEVSRRLKFV